MKNFYVLYEVSECPACNGSGEHRSMNERCPICRGRKMVGTQVIKADDIDGVISAAMYLSQNDSRNLPRVEDEN